jgi:ClpP class serine protease
LRGLTNKEKEYANTVVKEIYDELISEVSRGPTCP